MYGVVGCWRGYLSGAMCRFAYGPADATATHSLASVKSRLVFTFLVPAHLGSPGQRAVKRVCVCVPSPRIHCIVQHLQKIISITIISTIGTNFTLCLINILFQRCSTLGKIQVILLKKIAAVKLPVWYNNCTTSNNTANMKQ